MNERTSERANERTSERADERTSERTNERMKRSRFSHEPASRPGRFRSEKVAN